MNPHKTEEDVFHHHDLPPPDIIPQSQPSLHHNPEEDDPTFSLQEFVLFHSSPSHSSDSQDDSPSHPTPKITPVPNPRAPNELNFINPEPHISSQFYTFNSASHSLMTLCLRQNRLATPSEIRVATPKPVLKSWRSVWKDRNEDTAYLTAWKRIQDKLAVVSGNNEFLCFKNNAQQQLVSHVDQWQDIVMSYHRGGDGDLKHLGVRKTIERIKQVWTVGAKLYGIPESFIRVCVAACGVCNSVTGGPASRRNKRRRFEYTESFDVPAKDVPDRLQELASKHKVVLCIRQKYIRYKPFMAEVKDYACHRAGEPALKKSRVLKREPYQSKRCGCGFRIRAIVPIANYNEKDKTFVYQEEGTAVFKLYAVHSGHEPGAMDGNARIMHRLVGHKGFLMEQDVVYGVREDLETEDVGGGGMRFTVLHQVQELRAELGALEGKIGKVSREMLGSVSGELFEMLNKMRSLGDEGTPNEILVGDNDLAHWSDQHLYGGDDGKDAELVEDDEESFGRSLDDVVPPWEQIRPPSPKDILSETCKPEKWLKCSDFDEKSILSCEDSKLTKTMGDSEGIVSDVGLVGLQVDSFYQENSKWYDSPCEDNGFRHGEIL
ncbi:unnamed protein product [Brassica oleracea var. botrytis]|uniref:Uncharacterized protein n=2 Tax=Brassica TaxID=3705 RepID=A0A3P6GR18_BRAOL|nr:uncharacterized protein BNACNNG65030D [Brassica napus]CAF2059772.1 unnamed protein product [Brassica napus]CDY69729.1 BnaCnng65030D [Brassica napus]VDD62416.1 unnamed protein product [Brassica oleracea]